MNVMRRHFIAPSFAGVVFGVTLLASACGLETTGTIPEGNEATSASGSSSATVGSGGSSATVGSGGSSATVGSGGAGGGSPCMGTLVLCGGACVDTMTDALHCGDCATACANGLFCMDGSCKTCAPGATIPCYEGPAGTENVGACKGGTATCATDGSGYGACAGQVLPATETCGDAIDDDCNGIAETGSLCLVKQDLVARYFLDEAASGQAPPAALDSAPDPRDLAIAYTTQPVYTSVSTGRGLAFSANDSSGLVQNTTDNSKFFDKLNGNTQATIEVVAKIDGVTSSFDRIVFLGQDTSNKLSLGTQFTGGTNQLSFDLNATLGVDAPVDFTNVGRAVFHAVLDTKDADQAKRMRIYVNGALQASSSTTLPNQNVAIAIGAGQYFGLGNRDTSGRSMKGSLYYAAIYSRALTDAEIAQNVNLLKLSDDK